MPKPLPENYLAGTPGDDTLDIRGNSADFTVDGRAGNDTIYGGNGHDSLLGGRGDDLIYASVEDTLIDGGGGVDTVSFLYHSDISGAGVDTRLLNFANVENLTGSSYGDVLVGNRSRNELDGGEGNDWLRAFGSGDFLTGGADADTFDVSAVSRTVTITDFHYNEGDRIRIEGGAQFSWVNGVGEDADGNVQQAWIGTCDLLFGGTRTVIVLGADTTPSGDWII